MFPQVSRRMQRMLADSRQPGSPTLLELVLPWRAPGRQGLTGRARPRATCILLVLLAGIGLSSNASPVEAGCGDYVLVNGRPVAWLTPHGAKQASALAGQNSLAGQHSLAGQNSLADWYQSPVPRSGEDRPCHGPSCGERLPDSFPLQNASVSARLIEQGLVESGSDLLVNLDSQRLLSPCLAVFDKFFAARLERPPRI